MYMSKIRYTGITDKWGFRHICYTQMKILISLRFWPGCVALNKDVEMLKNVTQTIQRAYLR